MNQKVPVKSCVGGLSERQQIEASERCIADRIYEIDAQREIPALKHGSYLVTVSDVLSV